MNRSAARKLQIGLVAVLSAMTAGNAVWMLLAPASWYTTVPGPEARLVSDGGDEALGARNPIDGAEAIARFALGVIGRTRERLAWKIWPTSNLARIAVWIGDALQSVCSLELAGARIAAVYGVANPNKLRACVEPMPG